ncbi:dTDP-4-dehydrorhamnose reductase [Halomonas sp. McH1-25]|uniref:dTDP-4-dehydrorhamnose reductase n=1 Tax=unclassified Halomonas TaxID=2609666 RepID=UPI001EF4B67A|nr:MULTISPECIES: dTDP-4-dehydrorhamnose reductase [unclassified Halomonas]MCG7600443.1 dTDP-4-dehydrorhamnose reductase [Halomonas sp. McH1-25]MCP1344663.1 dTDP-4-dehydrorhamnose reductase [Halomonas sp. FL8]MCP1363182.1 dTDP-4-dehydrorhamnose reductase [Halomonas sp. BBD45]
MSESPLTWLVLGASGQVGRELRRALMPLGRGVALGRDACDLSVPGSIDAVLAEHSPQVVINAAAYTAVDKAESEPELARRINGEAVAELAHACRARNIVLVHYSTDYVFAGHGDRPFTEKDATGPQSVYGKTKLVGEQAILTSGAKALILRTSWVYASHGHNFVRTMLKLARERDHLRVIDDQIGAPTWAATIADVTAMALHAWQREGWAPGLAGTYHLTSRGAVSWHGFAEAVFSEAVALGLLTDDQVPDVEPIASHEYPQAAPRPFNSRLSTQRLETTFGITLPEWRTALGECLRTMQAT